MTLLVLHHTDEVGMGTLAVPIEARGVATHHVDVRAVDHVPLDDVTGVLVLGGRPVDDPGTDPWLPHEVQALRDAVERELPVFGLCFGAEVLAVALGGQVALRARPEAGFVALHRTEPGRHDPVTAGWPDGAVALALHTAEVVRLPSDAEQLLIGSDGPSCWRVGSAWATPLHVEADVATLEAWLATSDGRELVAGAGRDPEALLDEMRRRERFTRAVGVSLVLRWLDGEVGAGV